MVSPLKAAGVTLQASGATAKGDDGRAPESGGALSIVPRARRTAATLASAAAALFADAVERPAPRPSQVALLRYRNAMRKPGPAFNFMTAAAYQDGADYIYRVNDDTKFVGPWAASATATLAQFAPPNVGVVGPLCAEGNTDIMTCPPHGAQRPGAARTRARARSRRAGGFASRREGRPPWQPLGGRAGGAARQQSTARPPRAPTSGLRRRWRAGAGTIWCTARTWRFSSTTTLPSSPIGGWTTG